MVSFLDFSTVASPPSGRKAMTRHTTWQNPGTHGNNMVLSGIPGMSGNEAHAQTVDTRPFSPISQTGSDVSNRAEWAWEQG